MHNPTHIRPADYGEFCRWQEAAGGLIRIVTLSPEGDESLEFIRNIVRDGVVAAIGHTDADPDMIDMAIEAGATLSTHLGNGSPPMIPRLENFLWAQLASDRLSACIIADGFHLPPYVLQSIMRCKGRDQTVLVSDVAPLAGNPPGIYRWTGMDVEIYSDGHMGLHNTNSLAGASKLQDEAVTLLHRRLSVPLDRCFDYAALNPAQVLGYFPSREIPKPDDPVNLMLFEFDVSGMLATRTAAIGRHYYNTIKE
ncbi:MAG: hypothetical protein RQ801_08955 [Spirochaetaceae bacterium]|nr:hypothetical protein [Spirochaetaceae bacterium]MDT8298414.1 hypothetical protein [Spirochaetaceae bacterium]